MSFQMPNKDSLDTADSPIGRDTQQLCKLTATHLTSLISTNHGVITAEHVCVSKRNFTGSECVLVYWLTDPELKPWDATALTEHIN